LPRGHISEPEFQSAIAKVQGAFQALGLSTVKIQEIRNQANFPTSHLKKVLKEVKSNSPRKLSKVGNEKF